MKRIYLFSLLVCTLLLSGCVEDETIDITVLPEATTEGAQTFGCLIDGWVYVGGRYMFWPFRQSIRFDYYPERTAMSVNVYVKADKALAFKIDKPKAGESCTLYNVVWGEEEMPDGTAVITRFDPEAEIISGTFQAGTITEGRFDVHFATE